ncbi:hypothetical protein Q4567_02975 [Aliiglaciecola sp. 2_MG-2023]|uniref:hypothetical protein n=1 Tax=unclassified Aliiglaciecola TaxID=2593648 RepID=UPI0026E11C6A|nr:MULTISPECIES: hypothetical protein [unclassified Aliiglaciecola]MDO6709679.1 hypothetical protein [Aliiglaciecola sp. 2_MG-2023]MDO6750779.1 hypothetical protein [Aliiglaciecola sp. 1_MG-2023]
MFSNIEVLQHGESPYEIGKKQWELLDALKTQYEGSDMSAITHGQKFLDPIWYPSISIYEQIDFKRYFPKKNQYPLELFCRIACYELIQVNGYSGNTVFGRMASLAKFIKDSAWGGVMFAERDQPFLFFSELEPEEITNFAQIHLSKGLCIYSVGLEFLNMFHSIKHRIGLEIFVKGMSLPWNEQGIGFRTWVAQQQIIAGIKTEKGFYAPLPFENVSNIVQHALPLVLDYHDELINFFDEFNNLDNLKTYATLKRKKRSRPVNKLVEKYREILTKIIPIRYIDADSDSNNNFSQTWLSEILRLIQSACIWIVLLTTGLRNIDMRNLVVGCCQPSKRTKNMWWLVSDLKKTKNRVVIPVGEPTYKAVKLLESVRFYQSEFLIVNSSNNTRSHISGREYTAQETGIIRTNNALNTLLKILPNKYGFSIETIEDSDATAHCIRATLAGYIAENSHVAILILKRLFGHSNALMPNEYIRRNPLVIEKRKELQLKLTDSIANDMAYAVAHGEVSGRNGELLLKGANNIQAEIGLEARLQNLSLTEMELFQTLEERLTKIFSDDINNGETYALLTPMGVICNRSCNNTSDSPCAKQSNNQRRVEIGVKKAITDALSTLPNPAQCVGVACADALLGKKWSRPLLETFDYFHRYRKATSEITSIEEDAIVFLNTYAAPLMAIYGDEREEGYFNVSSS